ncbi:MAG: undecaprenyl-diphosphate phosphatase [Lachnospiraceae bacterium]|nr:undecaprenyl-diphosphate phosphatase [Lachnospiraceae bacterium]
MNFIEFLKIIILGIVEGITEWLPVSSTGHLLLFEHFLKPDMSPEIWEVFLVVIQLGAIMAVVLVFWNQLWPFSFKSEEKVKKPVVALWIRIIISCLPAAIIGFLLDDPLDEFFYAENRAPYVVSSMLVLYGIFFLLIEYRNKDLKPKYTSISTLPASICFYIGLFQLLALIPGTSRSGATIIGAMLIGTSRAVAAEYTFFLAVPVMAGASLLKVLKYVVKNGMFSGNDIVILLTGCIVAFLVSFVIIKGFLAYIRKHDFKPFGYYRIVAGIVFLIVFTAGL